MQLVKTNNHHTLVPQLEQPSIPVEDQKLGYGHAVPRVEYQDLFFDRHCYYLTMDNARLFVDNYAHHVNQYNSEVVKSHNNKVEKNLETNSITPSQQCALNKFKEDHLNRPKGTSKNGFKIGKIEWQLMEYSPDLEKKTTPRNVYHHNSNVVAFCEKHGYIIPMRTAQKLQPSIEKTIDNLISDYKARLDGYLRIIKKEGKSTQISLTKASYNSHRIANHTRPNGARRHNISQETVKKHLQRLEEAGFLTNVEYHGRKRPKKAFINSTILVIHSQSFLQKGFTDNQSLTTNITVKPCEVRDTLLNNPQISDVDNITSKDNLSVEEMINVLADGYTNTDREIAKKSNQGGAKNVKKTAKISENHRKSQELIQNLPEIDELAYLLSNGNNRIHNHLSMQDLEKEVFYGCLTKFELNDVLTVDLAKYAAKLYTGKNVYAGNWKYGIGLINRYFYTFKEGQPLSKHIQIELHAIYLAAIDKAYKKSVRKGWNTLFPAQFFDPLRTTYRSNGIRVYVNQIKSDQKSKETQKEKDLKRKRQAERNQLLATQQSKLMTKIHHFNKGKINLVDVMDYAAQNLDREFTINLNKYLEMGNNHYFKNKLSA